ncbi:hypothetical protein Glove_21g327 [Diversispora epigaea]|uniref:WAP domain-containing protein n=1 Tax=Diversispora epigaea TaxID=1348612 RepID=A0A397JMT6_9GLOM|nr:hypothetical protein Glove_21g327 [Diversispora epigaea]
MIWLNRNFLVATVTLIVSILLFSSQVTAKKCRTITKTRNYTKKIYPTNCPKPFTTITIKKPTTATTTTTATITTTALTTTISTSTFTTTFTAFVIEKRNNHYNNVICIPDKKARYIYYNHKKCEKIVFCTPTIYLPCPKVCTIKTTITPTSTSIAIFNTTITTTSTFSSKTTTTTTTSITFTIPETCLAPGMRCDLSNPYACCSSNCKSADPYSYCL